MLVAQLFYRLQEIYLLVELKLEAMDKEEVLYPCVLEEILKLRLLVRVMGEGEVT